MDKDGDVFELEIDAYMDCYSCWVTYRWICYIWKLVMHVAR